MKSYSMLPISGGILDNVFRAVVSAKDTAVRKSETQTVDVYFRGHRHDLVWGKIMVIPAAVCEGDFKDIPKPILEGALLRSFAGEDLAEYQTFRLSESKFDEPTKEQMKVFKEKLFTKGPNGKYAPIVLFLPAWQHPTDYTILQWVEDEQAMKQALRHLCFGAYYNPALSVLYDDLIVSEDKLDLVHLKDGFGLSQIFQSNPETSERPALEKAASQRRTKLLITAANVDEVMKDLKGGDSVDSEPALEPEEEAVLSELGNRMTSNKAATFLFTPGQVLREFYPEISENLLIYPQQNNFGMPEATQDNSANAGPASGSLNPKPNVIEESVPLRRELQLRGPGAMDQFYRSVVNIPSGRLQMAASDKKGAATPKETLTLLEILQGVCGEIAATMISAFKVTQRPLALGIPGEGSVVLDASANGDIDLSTQSSLGLGSQLKGLIRNMNDSDLQAVLNDSWAQASVWCNGEKGGFTYEVLVRAEAFDDESLELKYKYVTNMK
jgi:hypothetical protein